MPFSFGRGVRSSTTPMSYPRSGYGGLVSPNQISANARGMAGRSSGAAAATSSAPRMSRARRGIGINMEGFGSTSGVGRRLYRGGLETRGVRPEPGTRMRPRAPIAIPVAEDIGEIVGTSSGTRAAASAMPKTKRGIGIKMGGFGGTREVRPMPKTKRGIGIKMGGFGGTRGGGVTFGDMGMGIPSNATRGGHNIPMLARNHAAAPFGDMGMGIPANINRGSQNIPMLARPSPYSFRVRENIAASRRAREAGAGGFRRSGVGRTRAAVGAGAGAIDDAVSGSATAAAKAASENIGKKGKGFMKNGRGLAIGAGAAVIAGLAYSGRRGQGSSGGRTGMTNY